MIKFKGVKNFTKNIDSINRKAVNRYRVAMSKILLTVEAESARRTPVDTGNLRSSVLGNSIVYKSTKDGAKGVLYYIANYATYVHEITTSRHKVGEARFLAKAIEDKKEYIERTLGTDFRAIVVGRI